MPTIIALCNAGWDPVTLATVDPPSVLIERFGPKDGALYFTARNQAQLAVEAAVALDSQALGLALPQIVTRLPSARAVPVKDGCLRDTIEAGVACAYRVKR